MATYPGADDDVEIENETVIEMSIADITASVRAQLLIDARKKGNLFGPNWAQKKTPLASTPQPPGTRRVW